MTDIADRAMSWNEVFWTGVGAFYALTILCAFLRVWLAPPQRMP